MKIKMKDFKKIDIKEEYKKGNSFLLWESNAKDESTVKFNGEEWLGIIKEINKIEGYSREMIRLEVYNLYEAKRHSKDWIIHLKENFPGFNVYVLTPKEALKYKKRLLALHCET